MSSKPHIELSLPDLLFQQYCDEAYGMNRGIYNTVEYWLYLRGIDDILKRRDTILCFLKYVCNKSEFTNGAGRLKFGHGGLHSALNNYWLSYRME
jgi:riboflavin kinase